MLRKFQKKALTLFFFIIPVSFCLAGDFPIYSLDSVKNILPKLPVADEKPIIAIGFLQSNTNYDFKKMKVIDTELRRYAITLNTKGGLHGKRVHTYAWVNSGQIPPEIFAQQRIEMLKKLKGPLIIIDKEIAKIEAIKKMLFVVKVFIY